MFSTFSWRVLQSCSFSFNLFSRFWKFSSSFLNDSSLVLDSCLTLSIFNRNYKKQGKYTQQVMYLKVPSVLKRKEIYESMHLLVSIMHLRCNGTLTICFIFCNSTVSTCFFARPNSTPRTRLAKFRELTVSPRSFSEGLICTSIKAFESPPALHEKKLNSYIQVKRNLKKTCWIHMFGESHGGIC